MQTRTQALLISIVSLVGFAVASCVGDAVVTPTADGGPGVDASGVDSTSPTDAAVPDSVVPDAADTGPVIDGSYAFANNWDTFTNSGSGADSLAALPPGGFAVGGSYTGGVTTIGAYGLPAASGLRDAFLATLDSSGKVTKAIGFGGSGSDEVFSVAADSAGDIYLAGITFNGLTLNGIVLAAGTFIAKLDGKNITSAPKWTHSFEITISCGSCLATVGSDLDLATTFPNTVHYDMGKSVVTNGGFDVLLLKMDPATGAVKWGGQIGGSGSDTAGGLAVDTSQNLYVVAGYDSPTLASGQALGTKVPTGPGSTANLLLAKLDSSQAPVYAYAYGDPAGTGIASNGVAVDGAGRVAVGASFNGGVDFGMGPTGSSGTDAVVFVVDEAKGKTVWQQVIGDTGTDRSVGVGFDAWGHLVVAGTYQKTPQLGSVKLPPGGPTGAFMAKFSPAYAVDWFDGYPELGSGSVTPSDLVLTGPGTCVVSGGLGGSTDFGNGTVNELSSNSTADSFVAGRNP